jgi:crotonobetainyl-CoA:carnitine CoA-transferase CaiB-like acyl-CoA transferase
MRNPVQFSGTPLAQPRDMRPAPVLGEHTAQVVAEWSTPET